MKQLSTLASWHAEVAPNLQEEPGTLRKSRRRTAAVSRVAASISAKQTTKVPDQSRVRDAVRRELNVPKNSVEFAWIEAIEQTGRHDWYDPLCRRVRFKN